MARPSLSLMVQWAVPISAISIVSISLSLGVPLYGLLLENMGVSGWVIGLNQTAAALSMVLTAPLLPLIVRRIGLVRLMVLSIVLLAISMAAIPLWYSLWWWAALRLIWGFSATALFFASEFWLVAIAPEALRGRLIAVYAIILSGSYMIGPVLLNTLGIDGWLIFAVPTVIILLGGVPPLLSRHTAPDAHDETPAHPLAALRFFRSDPLILWGVVLFGAIEFGAMGLVTVWGLRGGFDQTAAVSLVFWLAFGSMAFQLPVGWAADLFDRRRLLALAGIVSVVMPLVMLAGPSAPMLTYTAIAVWGGMAAALYSLALTELGARYSGTVLAEGTAAIVLGYGIGALISPMLFGWAMDVIPPNGLNWTAALCACCYCALAAYRLGRKPVQTP